MVRFSKVQAAGQAQRLAQVRSELAAAYVVALGRWMGDRKLMLLGLPIVVEGYRSNAVQAAYYAQGRPKLYSLAQLNKLRVVAGLPPFPVGSAEAGSVITYKLPGTSQHNDFPSRAVDVALLQKDGTVKYDAAALLLFARLMRAADKRVTWGGDWLKFKDRPHFEVMT